jgi:hypothetical protein
MALFPRRAALPDDVRSALDLGRRERVLTTAPLTDGWVVATTHRLHVVPADGAPTRRSWIDVNAGRLDPEAATLTVTWVDGATPTTLHLADDRSMEFPRVFKQCVDTSLVHSERVALPSGASARVALRRDADEGLLTQVIGSGDIDLSDPAVAAAVDAAEVRVRDAAGLL